MSKKILNHPDKDEIVRMLTEGESVRGIEAKLKEKYPSNQSNWLSSVTLQKFRKDSLNLDGKVLKDIQEAAQSQKRQIEAQMRQRQLEASDAYRKKINELADSKLDVQRKILQLDSIIESRMEYWYNMIASGEETAAKGDNELRKYMTQQMELLAQYKKFVEGMADKTIDHNINITVMNDQIALIRDTIRECLAELGPEKAMLFMEKLNNKLKQTDYNPRELGRADPVSVEALQDAEFELLAGDTNE